MLKKIFYISIVILLLAITVLLCVLCYRVSTTVDDKSGDVLDNGFDKNEDTFDNDLVKKQNIFDNDFDKSGYIDPYTGNVLPALTLKYSSKFYSFKAGTLYFSASESTDNVTLLLYDEEKSYVDYYSFGEKTTGICATGYDGYFRVYTDADFEGNIYLSTTPPNDPVDYSCSVTEEQDPTENKTELTVVNFGDSIFGNIQDHSSVSAYIQRISGHTVYNFGFGGTTMGKRDNAYWDKFSFYSLVDAICDGDLSAQEAALDSGVYMPNYFRSTLKAIKSVDFDNVDVITIAYGTNDYHENVPLGTEDFDVSHYAGAFQYAVKRLQETYPHIRIIAVTPILRLFEEGTSDTYDPCGNGTLTDFKNALTDTAVKMHIPVVNAYDEMALSPYNRDLYYQTDDGTHINERGRAMLASLISAKIEAVCADLTVTPPNKTYGE